MWSNGIITCRHSALIAELCRREVASVGYLARRFGLTSQEVHEALQDWVEQGRVELLRPCHGHSAPNDKLDYYRWRHPASQLQQL